VHAALAGEPVDAVLVEHAGVEIGVRLLRRQHEVFELFGLQVVAHVRIQPAIGQPGRAVGSDDHSVRRRARADRNVLVLAGLWIDAAEHARTLAAVPDDAVEPGRHIVRARPLLDGEIAHAVVGKRRNDTRQCQHRSGNPAHYGVVLVSTGQRENRAGLSVIPRLRCPGPCPNARPRHRRRPWPRSRLCRTCFRPASRTARGS
jgi:hypothetical protein